MNESLELKLSALVAAIMGGAYIAYAIYMRPDGGSDLGHALGIIGTLLMLMTEFFYSARKRLSWLGWAGPLRWWLSVHIFTGLVGPFLVLLHTAFRFNGEAGWTMLLTALVVGSGFLGRYLYTAIPHSLAGAEATADELTASADKIQSSLASVAAKRSAAVQVLIDADAQRKRRQRGDLMLVLLRAWDEWLYTRNLHQQIRDLEKIEKRRLSDIESLLTRRRNLERQIRSMEAARRMLSVWHIAHVPMGMALFGSAAIHVVATMYFKAGLWRLLW